MSFTENSGIFAGAHENGINDFITAFFDARPRYLHFGSSFFVPTTTINATNIPAISLGGLAPEIHFEIRLDRPKIDLHPDTFGFSIPPQSNEFAIEIQAVIQVGCYGKSIKDSRLTAKKTSIRLCGRGEIDRGFNDFGFTICEVVLKDIRPDDLGEALACLLRQIANAMLSGLRIPYRSIAINIDGSALGTLSPTTGPEILDNQVQFRGNFA